MLMSKFGFGIPLEDADRSFRFDLLKGSENVEDIVGELATNRARLSFTELGTLAGIGVLDQYRTAKAKTNLRWWQHPGLILASLYGFLSTGLPLLGLAAGIAIDVAVFGGAAQSLADNVSPLFYAFAVGSLVFAIGLAIAPPPYKRTMVILMTIACLGASMIAADEPRFRAHFANWLPLFKTEQVQLQQKVEAKEQEIKGIQESIAAKQKQVQPVDGRPDLLNDGTQDNDEIARNIYTAIDKQNDQLVTARSELGRDKARLTQATNENAAQYLGRIAGGVYIFCWLLASQYLIAVVIEMAPVRVAELRRRAEEDDFAKRFVEEVGSTDRTASKGLVEAAVCEMLVKRFNPILAEKAKDDADKLESVTVLFEKAKLPAMIELGVELVCKTLVPRGAPQRDSHEAGAAQSGSAT